MESCCPREPYLSYNITNLLLGMFLSNTLSGPKEVRVGIVSIRGRPIGSLAYPGRLCVLNTVSGTPNVVTLSLPLGLNGIRKK